MNNKPTVSEWHHLERIKQMACGVCDAPPPEAYSNAEYIAIIEGLAAAIEIEETLKWRMEAAKLRVEIWRTESANNRMVDKTHE